MVDGAIRHFTVYPNSPISRSHIMALPIQLSCDMENPLARLVQASGHDPEFYGIAAPREHFDDIEDAYLAASIAREVRAVRMRTHSMEEMKRRLGLLEKFFPCNTP